MGVANNYTCYRLLYRLVPVLFSNFIQLVPVLFTLVQLCTFLNFQKIFIIIILCSIPLKSQLHLLMMTAVVNWWCLRSVLCNLVLWTCTACIIGQDCIVGTSYESIKLNNINFAISLFASETAKIYSICNTYTMPVPLGLLIIASCIRDKSWK